jgi:exodeoxyribonuclease V gamma subunit
MTKKELEQLLAEAAGLAERLTEPLETHSSADLDVALAEAGTNAGELRAAFHERVKSLESRLNEAGKTVPKSLLRVIAATAPVEQLARTNPKAAESQLRGWLRGFAHGMATMAPTRVPTIARAYRKTETLSESDSRLLDDLESELKTRDTPPDDKDGERKP